MSARQIVFVIYMGLGLFGALLTFVFATGGTFGQRCAKLYAVQSPAWNQCVEQLNRG